MTEKSIIVIVPGWQNSGPGHWQSVWANTIVGAVRVEQSDWFVPRRGDWVASVSKTILAVIVAAHSLGCIATVQLPAEVSVRIKGALLVAANPESRAPLQDFAPVPRRPLPYNTIVVGSSDDLYCPTEITHSYARDWGAELVMLPNAGHINIDSGFGDWSNGRELLARL